MRNRTVDRTHVPLMRVSGHRKILSSSETRFGEILPLWQNFKSLWSNFCRVNLTFAKKINQFGHIFMLLVKFWLLQMAKFEKLV